MTDPKKLNATIVDRKEVFNLRALLNTTHAPDMRLELLRIEHDKHEGGTQTVTRLLFERGHAVGVLGYDPKRDEVVLINEMRTGVLAAGDYPFTDNVVAGGIGKGETALEAAVREMKEEANLELKDPVLVTPGAYVSSGATSEKIAVVYGIVDMTKAGGVHGLAEESENIKSVILPFAEFKRRIRAGEITDLKSMVAGYRLAEDRDELRARYAPAAVSVAPKL